MENTKMNNQGTSRSAFSEERAFLDRAVETYVARSFLDKFVRQLAVRTFAPFVRGGRALELGCSDGYMTALISRLVDALDVIEGSKEFLKKAEAENIPNAKFVYSLFEEYKSDNRYDYVFATWALEHVLDVSRVLRMVRSVLKPDGLFFVVVPNANALSRQLALHMGLLKDLKNLTENDVNHGHRRVYDRVSLNRDLTEAGFVSISQGGILLKPLADFQMDKLIDSGILQEPQLDGLYRLGFEYPDLCGYLFSACKLSQSLRS
jgi:2-polyprenyl-3-methyl-5-hydroxy-6-metoxy-1,4-benzoquinol methylase